MKPSIHKKLKQRKRRIQRRLDRKNILRERDRPVFSANGICYQLAKRTLTDTGVLG